MSERIRIDLKLQLINKRIETLVDGMQVCTDPFKLYNLQASVEKLSEEHTKLSNLLNSWPK